MEMDNHARGGRRGDYDRKHFSTGFYMYVFEVGREKTEGREGERGQTYVVKSDY